MRIRIGLLPVALCALLAVTATAQDGRLSLNHLNRLYSDAVESFDVGLDAEVLRVLSATRPAGNKKQAEFNAALGGLKAVYAKGFRFAGPGRFSEADLAELRAQLSQPGWERVLTVRQKGRESIEMYLVPQQGNAKALAILSVSPTELYVTNLVGEIDFRLFDQDEGLRGLASLDQNWERWLDRRERRRWR
ncbi:MAG: DUF4252 domain-containing protein [Acidobacteriota bacterium]|nr:MAG: DUF4252 domain-containing protein [Acidobacteriota bacterium]